jgi:hypothetical protein
MGISEPERVASMSAAIVKFRLAEDSCGFSFAFGNVLVHAVSIVFNVPLISC